MIIWRISIFSIWDDKHITIFSLSASCSKQYRATEVILKSKYMDDSTDLVSKETKHLYKVLPGAGQACTLTHGCP